MVILGIETSCDETSAAVLDEGRIRSNIISSQLIHREYGGVVPELASRAHQRMIVPVVAEALSAAGTDKKNLDGIAVTYGPGLVGALLVGVNFGKALAFGLGIPFIGVNHMEAHIYANFIDEPKPQYPFLCLIVSGGHTQLVLVEEPLHHRLLGETLDDAAGEAYDKVAKMLGLGFPGGPAIDRLAEKGNPSFIQFPRSLIETENSDFSFSGVKTSVLYWLRDHNYSTNGSSPKSPEPRLLADLCASFQASVIDVLVMKALQAARQFGIREIAVAGGVSANSELRRRMEQAACEHGLRVFIPKLEYCTDNGAMIAMVGWMRLKKGTRSDVDLTAVANLSL
jgi:N6-L-threonylcarbamoyladenine synthase